MDENQLIHRISNFGLKSAIISKECTLTYDQVVQEIKNWEQVFLDLGIRSGESIALQTDFSPMAITLFLALIQNKNIISLLSPKMQADKKENLEISYATGIINFTTSEWHFTRLDCNKSHILLENLRAQGSAGLILYSSGSTGKIKASLHSIHLILNKFNKIKPSYCTIVFLLFDHIGGINTLLYSLANGGTMVIATDRSPNSICETIEKYRVELLPTTPTFLNMLLISQAYKHHDLSSLKMITYGTEPMPEATLHALHDILPHVRLKQTYGMTEFGIIPTVSENDKSIWIKIGGEGIEKKIINGKLWIRSPNMMLGYLNHSSPIDEDNWIDTGDMVERRDDYIKILGRDCEIINVGGEKVFPVEIENIILQAENIKNVVIKKRPNQLVGHVVVAYVEVNEPEDPILLQRRIRQFCRSRLQAFKVPARVIITQEQLHTDRYKKNRKT